MASSTIAPSANATSEPTGPTYEMCVWAQREPAKTTIGSIARSPTRTDHVPNTTTSHHSTGKCGFQASLSTMIP